jgi:IS605 OrfB family transposase
LRVTRRQADRCYRLLRSGGDVWAWLVDTNRQRQLQGTQPVVGYQALCKELTCQAGFGELAAVGARSILRRYSSAWFQASKRRRRGEDAGFPRRKRALVPVSYHNGTFELAGQRVRLPMATGHPELWVRLARPIPFPYPADQVRAVTLFSEGGLLWLSVTAVVPGTEHDLDPSGVAGVDLGIIHPFAVVAREAAMLVSGRAIRAESWLHLHDRQARQVAVSRRAPRPGQRGSRRWRRYRLKERREEARHRRRVRQAHYEAAGQVVTFAVEQRVGVLAVGDLRGITSTDAGRVQNWRLRQWRRTHLMQALCDKAELAGIQVRLVDERGTSSTCVACRRRVPKPATRRFRCPTARSKRTGISWVQPTSPPELAAELRARRCLRISSTVESASCRHGVTVAATCMTNGDEGPAWPRAACIRIVALAGVARRTQHFRRKRRGSSSVAH